VSELKTVFAEKNTFPEMLLMQEVSGTDVDNMSLSTEEGTFIGPTHKTRERDREGVIDRGELLLSEQFDQFSKNIVENFGIKYIVGI
jgi:hypothetical protein